MDHQEQIKRKIHPRESSNIISKLLFLFVIKLYHKGYRKDFEEQDLYEIVPHLKAKELGDKLEKEWQNLKTTKRNQNVINLLWKCYGFHLLLLGVIHFVADSLLIIIGPYSLSKLLAYFQEGQTKYTKNDAYFYAALMIGSIFLEQLYKNNFWFYVMQFGCKIRISLCSFLYRKALKLHPSHSGNISIGKIVTLITKDVTVFESYVNSINEIWQSVIKTFLISYLLYNKIGSAAFVGIAFLIFILPFQFFIASKITKIKLKTCKRTDDRLQIIQETLSAIRIIKMYTWEKIFQRKIIATRKKEVNATYKLFFLQYSALGLGRLNSEIGFYLLLITYLWMGHYLTADLVYFIVHNFQTLNAILAYILPVGLYRLSEIKAAIKRIENVLKATEIQSEIKISSKKFSPTIQLNNVTVSLNNQIILDKINLNLHSGLIVITGSVGSGKSTLLKTILNNYKPDEGEVIVHGSISYASQDPWLFPSSIRQNILFGEEYNEKRYQQVLKVCALIYDLELMKAGDGTIVEDRGINLSKGQQIRINLARAIYKSCDIYLLDDCLATLDANVSGYIFQKCIQEFLNNKIVVFTSHNNKYVKYADQFLYILNGQITSRQFKRIENKTVIDKNNFNLKNRKNNKTEEIADENSVLLTENVAEKKVYQESKQKGAVTFDVYKNYLKYGGGYILFFFVLCTFALHQYISSFNEKLLSDWVNLEERLANFSRANLTDEYNEEYKGRAYKYQLYNIVNIIMAATNVMRTFAIFLFAKGACLKLHKHMIDNIINSNMRYFDNNFIGNMLNRFSKDLKTVDETVPEILFFAIIEVFALSGTLIMIMVVNADFIIPVLFFITATFLIRKVVVQTSRCLQRLDAATRSPIVGYLNATLEGLTTIRALKAQNILKDEFDRHLDLSTSAHYMLCCSLQGMGVIVNGACDFFIAYIILRFLWADKVMAGTIGLGITQAISLSWMLQWGILQFTEVENQMTSVERVLEYTKIKQENKQGLEIANWPKSGEVVFENVSLSYKNSENYVLQNLNFTIKPTEKIGIVGRTGAGKSSIIASLFRLYEVEGRILIDGVDTKTLSLDFLRKNISIIPQDPVLFTGTIRENIDPMNNYTDQEIWNAIKIANLENIIPNLEYEIVDSGAQFSIGQKQFICLARAIVRKNKIIVLDEATANMDEETDKLIYKTIKSKFKECTVITIAHKLKTILEADRIMVLEKGDIREFDSPGNLLKNQNSVFYQMAQKDSVI